MQTGPRYSKWWRGVGAAVQQVRPGGDSTTTTRFLQVLKGVCATPSGH